MNYGFLLINKPANWTSHDVVAYIRSIIRKSGLSVIRKVGHAGTLDPFATGLLIIGIGREATKRLGEFKKLPKTYIATIKLGFISDTYDSTGRITPCHNKQDNNVTMCQCNNKKNSNQKFLSKKIIKKIIKSLKGKQSQLPPMYSAKKVKGKKLYELARKDIEIERKLQRIEIYKIKLLFLKIENLKIEISCSAGTYIRTLAHDIGQKLGTGAYCAKLERTKIGKYKLKNAVSPKDITKDNLQKYLF